MDFGSTVLNLKVKVVLGCSRSDLENWRDFGLETI